jgi:uncharacterized membrane protein YkoI
VVIKVTTQPEAKMKPLFMFPSCDFRNLGAANRNHLEAHVNKQTLATLGATAALMLGVIGTVALAESPPPSARPSAPVAPKQTATTGQTETQEPSYTGSVQAPKDTGNKHSEAAESAALAALAKISEADARNAALAKFPGAAIQKATLEDENGNVVWAVELTPANKSAQEVKVDAGNAAILATEAGGADAEKSGGRED